MGHSPELPSDQTRVEPVLPQQVFVRSLFGNATFFKHDDPVRAAHSAQPVRNDQTRPTRHQPVEGGLHQCFAFGLEGAGGFVEDQDPRVL